MKNFKVISIISFFVLAFSGFIAFNLYNESFADNSLPKLSYIEMDKTASNQGLNNLNLKTVPSNLPQKLTVYRVVTPNLTSSDIKATANKLGINGNIEMRDKDFRVFSLNGDYIVDRMTGSFSYMTRNFTMETNPIKNTLSTDEYVAAAKKFLNDKGFIKEGALFKTINKHTVTTLENGQEITRPFMIEIIES